MVDLNYYLTNLLFLGVPLLCYHVDIKLLTIFCLFSRKVYLSFRKVYLSLGISLSCSIFSIAFATVSELFYDEVLETFIILLVILLPF